jgi:hypothetical protein
MGNRICGPDYVPTSVPPLEQPCGYGCQPPTWTAYGWCYATVDDAIAHGDQEDATCVWAHHLGTGERVLMPLWNVEGQWVRE